MKLYKRTLVGLMALLMSASVCSEVAIHSSGNATPHGIPLDIGENISVAHGTDASKIRDAIKVAAREENWQIQSEASGVMTIRYPKKSSRYHLILNVYYDNTGCRLRYVSSQGLDAHYDCQVLSGYRQWTYYPVCFHRTASRVTDKLKSRIAVRLNDLGNQGAAVKAKTYY